MLKWHYSKPPRNKTFIYFDPYKNTFLIHFDNNNWREELNAFMFWTEESKKNIYVSDYKNRLFVNYKHNPSYCRSTLRDQFDNIIDIENENDKALIQWYKDLLNQ